MIFKIRFRRRRRVDLAAEYAEIDRLIDEMRARYRARRDRARRDQARRESNG